MEKPSVAIIGAGAVGSALAQGLARVGYPIITVVSRRLTQAQVLADLVGAEAVSTSLHAVPESVDCVFCCVPDDVIGEVAQGLCEARPDWSDCVIAHTSGVATASALDPLHEHGAALLSFHPLQTFPNTSTPNVFEGIYIGIEGDERALLMARQMALDLGAQAFTLTPEAKTRYHLAASMASNYFVTLMALAGEVMVDINMDRTKSAALLRPLVESTWQNLERHLPEDVLTGPVARGDRFTVADHLNALAKHLPHLIPVYAALGAETVRVAVRSGQLDPSAAQHLLDILYAALDPNEHFP